MKTLGIDLADAGLEIACATKAGEAAPQLSVLLGDTGLPVTASALSEEGRVLFGADAETRRFYNPRQICDAFLEELSRQPSTLRHEGRGWSKAEVAYHFLREQMAALPTDSRDHDAVVLAVPAPLFEDSAQSEEQLGLLLAICGDLEIKLAAVVDGTVAALADPQGVLPSRGKCLVVDLGLRAAQLTMVEVGAQLRRISSVRLPGAGRLALADTARRALADRFLRQTSFDVLARRDTEQAFHNQTLALLGSVTSKTEGRINIVASGQERSIPVSRDMLAADLKPLTEVVVQAAIELAARERVAVAALPVYISSRAALLAGLSHAFRARGALTVGVLPAGAAARGAALLATERSCPEDIANVPLESGVACAAQGDDVGAAVRRTFGIRRGSAHRHLAPTHVVIDGLAHALTGPVLRVGFGGGQASVHAEIPSAPEGVGPCELVFELRDRRWFPRLLVEGSDPVSLPGGDVPLAPGDSLEVGTSSGTTTLDVIALQRA